MAHRTHTHHSALLVCAALCRYLWAQTFCAAHRFPLSVSRCVLVWLSTLFAPVFIVSSSSSLIRVLVCHACNTAPLPLLLCARRRPSARPPYFSVRLSHVLLVFALPPSPPLLFVCPCAISLLTLSPPRTHPSPPPSLSPFFLLCLCLCVSIYVCVLLFTWRVVFLFTNPASYRRGFAKRVDLPPTHSSFFAHFLLIFFESRLPSLSPSPSPVVSRRSASHRSLQLFELLRVTCYFPFRCFSLIVHSLFCVFLCSSFCEQRGEHPPTHTHTYTHTLLHFPFTLRHLHRSPSFSPSE